MTTSGLKPTSYVVGKTYTNSKGLDYLVLGKTDEKTNSGNYLVRIRFKETGYEYNVEPVQIRRGTVKDRMTKTVLGIGSIGEVKVKGNEMSYNVWHKMLARCYYPENVSYKTYGAMGVRVSERWKCFQYFLEDIPLVGGVQ